MKEKGYMIKNLAVISAILLSACSSGSTAVTETTAETYTVSDTAAEETGNTTTDTETTEKEPEEKTTEDKTVKKDQTEDTSDTENTETGAETEENTEETTEEDTAEAETTIEETTARENNKEESTSEKQTVPTTAAPTTVAQTTKAPAVPTPVTTTAAPTTTPTTAAKVLTGITASISNKTRYVGTTLSAADFTVTALYSDGSTATNPYGWYAGPMKLENAGSNTITVVYDTAVTTVNVVASVQQTVASTTAAPTTAVTTKPAIDNRLKNVDWAKYEAFDEETMDLVETVCADIYNYYYDQNMYNTGDHIKDMCLASFYTINLFRRACGCSELIWSDVLYEKALRGAKGVYDYEVSQGFTDIGDNMHLAALRAEGYTVDALGGIEVGTNIYGYPSSAEDICHGCPGFASFIDDNGHRSLLTEENGIHYTHGAVAYYQDSEGYAYGCFDVGSILYDTGY